MMPSPSRQSSSPIEEISEINMTPFIDVMLVLLIIFMVAVPLSKVEIPLELPSSSSDKKVEEDDPIVISLTPELDVYINDDKIKTKKENLLSEIMTMTNNDTGRVIYIRADNKVDYGNFVTLLDDIRSAGYTKISLISNKAE
ncbi:ExbD/TolR family protein [Pseudomonas sp. HK3]